MLVRKILQRETGMSRRACFRLFTSGSVCLNGEQCDSFKASCVSGDIITYQQAAGGWKKIVVGSDQKQAHQTIIFHKPVGYVVARSDRFEKTIYDLLPQEYRTHYRSAGRLDKATSGLLILSNDGDLIHQLSHPSHHIPKVYRVVLHRPFTHEDHRKVLQGVETPMFDTETNHTDILSFGEVKGVDTRIIHVTLLEGKKRHIRRLLRQLGYKILTLQRQSIGPLQLGSLGEGEYRTLSASEMSSLYAHLDYAPQIS